MNRMTGTRVGAALVLAIIAVLVIGYVWRLWTHRHAAKGD